MKGDKANAAKDLAEAKKLGTVISAESALIVRYRQRGSHKWEEEVTPKAPVKSGMEQRIQGGG